MRSKRANWFEAKVQYEKVCEDGVARKTTDLYVVEAVSYTEAESRVTAEVSAYGADFEVKDLKKAQYEEVFFSDEEKADRYYKAKLDFITLDEKSGSEKRNRAVYLVQAASLHDALRNVDEMMAGTMTDFEACAIDVTKIVYTLEA